MQTTGRTMDSAFKRPAWVWDDESEEPVPIDPDDASREELAEALENTRREMYELERELSRKLNRLQREVERLEPSPVEIGEAGRSGNNGHA